LWKFTLSFGAHTEKENKRDLTASRKGKWKRKEDKRRLGKRFFGGKDQKQFTIKGNADSADTFCSQAWRTAPEQAHKTQSVVRDQ
jgi:hypothetical protein